MAEVLLLEDEPVLRQELCEFLEEQGYAPLGLPTLEAFEQAFDPQRHHLAVIDLGLPDGNGLDLIERLRQDGRQLGIVVFSARHASADRIRGLATGADHFLGKGCDLDELAATLGALSRRLRLDPGPRAATAGCWILESGPRRLKVPGAPAIALSQQDLQVLRCLMSHAGQNISRRQIIEALGADYLDYDQRRLDTQMRRLRRRVQEASGQQLPVKTLRNSGYCFYLPAAVQP
ncbi:response regulator transcription factor [Bordetella hinzii]|uniref:DNA-binding response regulator n=2 Tax=Bordetella hinzii TaxID=103855 RepID=A0AAN1VGF7_9BORD|nr:response regulator transcription factor [Bordetella hinzii]AKQ57052.1 Phosphate regulon transcriptional regulatory protein PhoB [Bordetella hinzii]AKQ61518.1 Phosphate regulon transcriptional regulatory protein PhoB [Bordetella hinzii]AZW17518.1 DNA-binding response regulator [Bordetella hinzii]KCB23945.1 response regulator receiver domain protein [Bordetella hinzii OH87 BAL007II]KCB24124.1 response regulator receiver domain protein [Bordetella hinzii L60]